MGMGFQLKIFRAFILAFAAFTLLQSSTSHAQYMMRGEVKKISGPEYKQSFFDTLSISDFKLYMSSTEAEAIIKRDGWKGGWDNAPELPETIETVGYPYTQGKDTSVDLYRYRRSDDGTFRIYAIEFIRRFDQDQSLSILTQKLIEKYGDPTNTEISKKLILLQYSPNRTMRDNERCKTSQMKGPQCMAYVAWAKGPKFTIKITSRAIEMTLEDQTEALNHQSNILARKNLGKEILKRETTKELNLDF